MRPLGSVAIRVGGMLAGGCGGWAGMLVSDEETDAPTAGERDGALTGGRQHWLCAASSPEKPGAPASVTESPFTVVFREDVTPLMLPALQMITTSGPEAPVSVAHAVLRAVSGAERGYKRDRQE